MSEKSTSSNQTQTQDTTSTPTPAPWLSSDYSGLSDAINQLGSTNPQSYVAGDSPLQTQAYGDASNLGTAWQPFLSAAGQLTAGAGSAGANTYDPMFAASPSIGQGTSFGAPSPSSDMPGAQAYNADGSLAGSPVGSVMSGGSSGAAGPTSTYQAAQSAGPNAGPASTYRATGYNPGSIANPTGYGASTYAPTMAANVSGGPAPTYQASQAGASGYAPALIDPTSGLYSAGAAAQGAAGTATGATALPGISQYMDPATQDLVNTTLAGYDQNSGVQNAQLAAQQALTGAFAGSRSGVESAVLAGQQGLGRAQTQAQLETNAFTQASGLANEDADRQQSASNLNAQDQTQASLANAQQTNQQNQFQAGLYSDLGLANQSSLNQAGQFGAGATNTANLANQGATNAAASQGSAQQSSLDQLLQQLNANINVTNAGAANTAGQFNADAGNTANAFNAGATNTADQAQFAANQASGQFNAGATNTAAQTNAGAQNSLQQLMTSLGLQNSQFNAGATNTANATNSAATNAMNQFLQSQSQQAGQFNAGQANTAGQFNASQAEAALMRQLQAGTALGNQGVQAGQLSQGDVASQLAAGGQQQQTQQNQLNATPTMLQLLASLYGSIPTGPFTGATQTGTGTQTGNSTTTGASAGLNLGPIKFGG